MFYTGSTNIITTVQEIGNFNCENKMEKVLSAEIKYFEENVTQIDFLFEFIKT